ncbi:torsin-like protein [Drosophila tropicalis]|uniref:torsin-like protein n=1 Tax=Drosophila tropicalis TaxID=46794 RepID=UPI0035ABDD1D
MHSNRIRTLYFNFLYIFIILCYTDCANGIEPFTATLAVGMGAAGYGFFKDQTYCRFYECCDERSIPGLTRSLEYNLQQHVYGQHLVNRHIVQAMSAHFNNLGKSRKPLVISFHGQPGTGKNFVAEHIAKALYTRGSESKFVHKFLGRADFPEAKLVDTYKRQINDVVRTSLSNCPRSLFIFDEVDKMPSGIFETLASLADYNAFADGTDNTKAIFIFLSNTAGVHISDHLGTLMKGGKLREETRLSDFEPLLQKAAYNIEGGLQKTSLIESHVIDHYMPFLPLEKSHVMKCLEAEFRRWNRLPDKAIMDEIIRTSIIFDPKHGIFSISGCKTLEKKVAMAIN